MIPNRIRLDEAPSNMHAILVDHDNVLAADADENLLANSKARFRPVNTQGMNLSTGGRAQAKMAGCSGKVLFNDLGFEGQIIDSLSRQFQTFRPDHYLHWSAFFPP